MPEIPIKNTDLTATVTEEVAARLEALNRPGPRGERYGGYVLVLKRGDVYLINERYNIDEPLKRWITNAPSDRWVVFVNGLRRDFSDRNLAVVLPENEYAIRQARPALEQRVSIDPRFAWIPDLQGFVLAQFGRKNARKQDQQGSSGPRWKSAMRLACFSTEQAFAVHEEQRRADRLKDIDENLQRERQRQKDRVQAARDGAATLAANLDFIPLGYWLSAAGKTWETRKKQSAFLVMFGLQYRRTIAKSDSFLVDYADLEPKLGLNPVAIWDTLDYLEEAGDISTQRRKGTAKIQGRKGSFPKNHARRCSFSPTLEADHCTGRFPTALFADPTFRQFEKTAKGRTKHHLPARDRGVLVALYLMAEGQQSFKFKLPHLMRHAGFEDKDTVLKALKALHQLGLLTDYNNPCTNPRISYEKTDLFVRFRVWV